ncbi:hypothetical protein J4526_09445 [Desulfurococcaceae archaeon MEX13E-LK6-19]|nr:hypothetical protein J4526_09445 [Desulfurococcaceae archaeon MEX13E-LK6-19]
MKSRTAFYQEVTSKFIIMLLVVLIIQLHIETTEAQDYAIVKISIVYPDSEPASNILVVLSYDVLDRCPYCIIGKNTTDTNGSTEIIVPQKYIGREIYVNVFLPIYNIPLLKSYPLTINSTGHVEVPMITLDTKPEYSAIMLSVSDEYANPLNALVKLFYGNELIYEGYTNNTSLSINMTLKGIPIVSSDWLQQQDADPFYKVVAQYNGAVTEKLVKAPSITHIIIDRHPPAITSIDALVKYYTKINYVSIVVIVHVTDGLNTNYTTVSSKLTYNTRSIILRVEEEKIVNRTKIVKLSYSFIDFGGVFKSCIQANNVYIHVTVNDHGGHIVEETIAPVIEFDNEITSVTTTTSPQFTQTFTSNNTGSNTGTITTTYPSPGFTSFNGNASFMPPNQGSIVEEEDEYNKILLGVVFTVLGTTTFALEYYRRRIQDTYQ